MSRRRTRPWRLPALGIPQSSMSHALFMTYRMINCTRTVVSINEVEVTCYRPYLPVKNNPTIFSRSGVSQIILGYILTKTYADPLREKHWWAVPKPCSGTSGRGPWHPPGSSDEQNAGGTEYCFAVQIGPFGIEKALPSWSASDAPADKCCNDWSAPFFQYTVPCCWPEPEIDAT